MWKILYFRKRTGKRFQAADIDWIGLLSRKVDWNGSCLLIYYYRQIIIIANSPFPARMFCFAILTYQGLNKALFGFVLFLTRTTESNFILN